jgi:anti-anti-sigma factor
MTVFAISEMDIWPGCREIEVEGELDLAVSERLRVALQRATEQRHHVLVDLSRCDFLDARALAVLIEAHQSLQEHGCQLLLYGVQGQVRRILSVSAATETGLLAAPAAPNAPRAVRSGVGVDASRSFGARSTVSLFSRAGAASR